MVALTRRKQAPRSSRIATRTTDGGDRAAARARGSFEREYRRLERLCGSLRAEAEEAQIAQATLLQTISHDLRNPLTALMMTAPFLSREVPPGQPGRRNVEAITRSAEELNQIINNISDAGRIEAGLLVVARAEEAVGPMIEQALGSVRRLAEHRGVRLSSEITDDAPAVFGDRDRIIKVITNLVSNAIKFVPKQGSITVRAEIEDSAALFSVTDTGPGLSEEQQAYLFTLPPRTRRRIVQGEGLLPYVTKGIVEAHSGRIWVESEVGKGCTFFFTLPMSDGEAEPIN